MTCTTACITMFLGHRVGTMHSSNTNWQIPDRPAFVIRLCFKQFQPSTTSALIFQWFSEGFRYLPWDQQYGLGVWRLKWACKLVWWPTVHSMVPNWHCQSEPDLFPLVDGGKNVTLQQPIGMHGTKPTQKNHIISGIVPKKRSRRWLFLCFFYDIQVTYPPAIKHGVMENGPFLTDFLRYKPTFSLRIFQPAMFDTRIVRCYTTNPGSRNSGLGKYTTNPVFHIQFYTTACNLTSLEMVFCGHFQALASQNSCELAVIREFRKALPSGDVFRSFFVNGTSEKKMGW